jgi:hypothetical protein
MERVLGWNKRGSETGEAAQMVMHWKAKFEREERVLGWDRHPRIRVSKFRNLVEVSKLRCPSWGIRGLLGFLLCWSKPPNQVRVNPLGEHLHLGLQLHSIDTAKSGFHLGTTLLTRLDNLEHGEVITTLCFETSCLLYISKQHVWLVQIVNR